jgi:regulator of protease activity HflC (stomatin/prohibitin superfamily)
MIFGFITAALFIAGGVGAVLWAIKSEDTKGKTPKASVALLIVCILGFLIIPFSFHTVQTGELAVVKQLGEAKYERSAGTYFDFWFISSYQMYDCKVQNIDITTAAYSSDAQTMDVTMTMQYQILNDKATDICKQYGSLEALQSRIQAIAIEKVKAVLSAHKAMDIIADRAAMSPAVEEAIRTAVGEDYFVNIVAVVVTNIDFSDAFEQAVENKMIAEQNQLKAEYENQQKVAQAQADADAKIIAAEAEAKANELLENSLTDQILESKYLDKWNGSLPQVVSGDSGLMFSIGE